MKVSQVSKEKLCHFRLPPRSLFFLCSLVFISPLEPSQRSSLFLSSITVTLLLIKDTHRNTHTDAYVYIVARPLSLACCVSQAETHRFGLTHGHTHLPHLLVISVLPRPPAMPSDTKPEIKQACFHSPARRLMVHSGPASYLDEPEGGSI